MKAFACYMAVLVIYATIIWFIAVPLLPKHPLWAGAAAALAFIVAYEGGKIGGW